MEDAEKAQLFSLLLAGPTESLDYSKNLEQIQQMLSFLTTDSSSSSDSEDSDRKEHFVQTIDSFGDEEFKSHMKMQRSTVQYLISKYSKSVHEPSSRGGKTRIGARRTVYMYVWYVSNTVTFRQLGKLFGVSQSSAWIAVRRVAACLIQMGHEFVKWPTGAAVKDIQEKFKQKEGVPGVIGAIGCTHITIKAPKHGKDSYMNRKQSYSLVLQAVVDANKRFIDITCGEPGSLSESKVLQRSELYARAQTNYEDLFPSKSFIVGDSAYDPSSWLVPSFKDYGNLTESQDNFNRIHSVTRCVAEDTLTLLKGRFRRLRKLTEEANLTAITNLTVSACVLHNICISHNDLYSNDELVHSDDDSHSDNIQDADSTMSDENSRAETEADVVSSRREELFNYLREKNLI